MAWQWGWQYRLPGDDGKLGTTKVINISDENPFGINPDDPFGQDDVIIQSDVLNMETNRPIKILLRSVDVLHNWYVPQFRALNCGTYQLCKTSTDLNKILIGLFVSMFKTSL